MSWEVKKNLLDLLYSEMLNRRSIFFSFYFLLLAASFGAVIAITRNIFEIIGWFLFSSYTIWVIFDIAYYSNLRDEMDDVLNEVDNMVRVMEQSEKAEKSKS